MICDICKKREATVVVTRIINDEKVQMSLCEECAARQGAVNPMADKPFNLSGILSSMVGKEVAAASEKYGDTICPVCKLSFETFTKTGRMGCGSCFTAFREPMADLLRRIHGSNLHRGRRQTGKGSAMEPLKEEVRLKEELRRAIKAEDFERAAQLRDLLKDVHRKLQASDV